MKRFTTHEFSFDVLPALSLRLPLTRKGRGFLQLDGHVRPRECSAQRCDRDRALIRNRRTSTPLFQALRHLSAPCGNHSTNRFGRKTLHRPHRTIRLRQRTCTAAWSGTTTSPRPALTCCAGLLQGLARSRCRQRLHRTRVWAGCSVCAGSLSCGVRSWRGSPSLAPSCSPAVRSQARARGRGKTFAPRRSQATRPRSRGKGLESEVNAQCLCRPALRDLL